MKKILVLSSLVLAASLVASPLAFAQDAPSAAVKAAICASASVDAVSGAADQRVINAKAEKVDADAAVLKANTSADKADPDIGPVAGRTAVEARITQIEKHIATVPTTGPERAAFEVKLKARQAQVSAITDAEKALTEQERALSAQADAEDLEADVKTFVGFRDFAVVKTELCTTPAPTPTPTPAPTPAPAPGVDLDCNDFPLADGRTAQGVLNADPTDPHHLDVDGDKLACEIDQPAGNGSNAGGDFSQVGELPSAIDTGRA